MIVTPAVLPLSEVVKPTRPKVKPSGYEELPFVGLEHVEAHTTRLLGTVPASTMKSNAIHFQPGDVLYSRLRPYLNKVVLADFEGLCSSEFIVLPENEQITGPYLKYLLNSWDFVQFANGLNTGDRPRVDFKQISDFPVYLPSVDEQKEIVAAIETQFARLDDAVAALQRSRTRLKRYRASVLKAGCEGRLVLTEAELARQENRSYEPASVLLERLTAERDTGPGKRRNNVSGPRVDVSQLMELPEGWAWTSLGEISDFITSGSRGWARYYSDEGATFVRAQDINTDHLILRNTAKVRLPENVEGSRTRLNHLDILVTITGANVTKSALVLDHLTDAFVSQHVGLVRPIESSWSPFVYLWIVSPTHGRRILEKSAYGAGKPGLGLDDLRELPVPLPPSSEQERIVEEVERRLSIIDQMETTVETNLKRAESLRQSILRMGFSVRLLRPGNEVGMESTPTEVDVSAEAV